MNNLPTPTNRGNNKVERRAKSQQSVTPQPTDPVVASLTNTCSQLVRDIVSRKQGFDRPDEALLEVFLTVTDVALLTPDSDDSGKLESSLRALIDCLSEVKDIVVGHQNGGTDNDVLDRLRILDKRIQKLVEIVEIPDSHLSALDFFEASETLAFWEKHFGNSVYSVTWEKLESALKEEFNESVDDEMLLELQFLFDNFNTGHVSCHRLSSFSGSDPLGQKLKEYRDKVVHLEIPPPLSVGLSYPLLLWVDDAPENNESEILYAKDKGICVICVHGTAEAKEWLINHANELDFGEDGSKFRIITDNVRKGANTVLDINAGEDIIRFVRGRRYKTPILVYCGDVRYARYTSRYANCKATTEGEACYGFIDELALR